MTALANRRIAPNVRLPIIPAPGTGVVTPSCEDRDERYPVAQHVGRMLRIGGEVRLCFDCGPDGGVYHPSHNVPADGDDFDPEADVWAYSMQDVRAVAERIFLHDGDGTVPPTAAELDDFDRQMRRAYGIEP